MASYDLNRSLTVRIEKPPEQQSRQSSIQPPAHESKNLFKDFVKGILFGLERSRKSEAIP